MGCPRAQRRRAPRSPENDLPLSGTSVSSGGLGSVVTQASEVFGRRVVTLQQLLREAAGTALQSCAPGLGPEEAALQARASRI